MRQCIVVVGAVDSCRCCGRSASRVPAPAGQCTHHGQVCVLVEAVPAPTEAVPSYALELHISACLNSIQVLKVEDESDESVPHGSDTNCGAQL